MGYEYIIYYIILYKHFDTGEDKYITLALACDFARFNVDLKVSFYSLEDIFVLDRS